MKIAVLDDYLDSARGCADWTRLDAEVVFFRDALPAHDDARAQALASFDAIVAMRERTPFSSALIARLPQLRLLVTTGMRNHAIDMAACRARGIDVCGAPGSPESAGATAELAWALMLALFKRIPQEHAVMTAGGWQTAPLEPLAGKRLGVVGLGNLGQRVARVGLAFGMEVAAWSPNLTDARADAVGVARVDKQALFATSDVVSLHLVLGEATRGIVDAAALAAMKPTAYLVNTARAGLVDQDALLEVLRTGRIAGAGLDVYPEEPLAADAAIRRLPCTVLTPHLGYVTPQNFSAFYRHAVDAIAAWAAGQPVRVLNSQS